MEDDLKLCLARVASPTLERSACFELISRNGSHLLQADSENMCKQWMHIIQVTIHHLHEDDGTNKDRRSNFIQNLEAAAPTSASVSSNGSARSAHERPRHAAAAASAPSSAYHSAASTLSRLEPGRNWFEQVKRVPGNRACADCGSSDAKWASINLGVCFRFEFAVAVAQSFSPCRL